MDKRVKAFKHSQFTSSLLVFGNMWVCGAGGTPDRQLYGEVSSASQNKPQVRPVGIQPLRFCKDHQMRGLAAAWMQFCIY